MPFDQFFSSANKKHYIENPEATELYKKLVAMPFDDRLALIDKWRARGFTKTEYCVFAILRFHQQGRRWAKVHKDDDSRIDKAIQELKEGKRVIVQHGFGSVTGARNIRQKRSSRH